MMDRNREARRAAAMANSLQRRRHRTTTGSLRDSPEDDGPLELQETARLRDRTVKKDRDREMRDRDRDRERDRDRLSRSKRRRGVDKYMHGGNRDDGGGGGGAGGGDESSEESVNDEDEEEDDGPIRFAPPSNLPLMSSPSTTSTLTHRKSFPPPTKVFRSSPVVSSWKAPDEMIGVPVPRKARSASTKRSHDCWSIGGGVVGGDQILQQASSSPVRSSMTAAAATQSPLPSQAPMSPSSSNVSIKKKIKPNGPKQKPPPKSCPKSSPSIQDEIEIEVAEVLYGLMRQTQAPSSSKQEAVSNDSAKFDRSASDSKSRASSPSMISAIPQPSPAAPQNSSSKAPPLTTVAPKRKRPRPYPDENLASRSSPILPVVKAELDQTSKTEAPPPSTEKITPGSAMENGDLAIPHIPALAPPSEPGKLVANGVVSDARAMVGESECKDLSGRAKVEEVSSSPKMDSQGQSRVVSTSTKANSAVMEKNHREEKFEIDLMAPPPSSRASPEEAVECGGGKMGDEKSMVTDREAEAKANEVEDEKEVICSRGAEFNVSAAGAEADKPKAAPVPAASEGEPHKQPPSPQPQQLNLNSKEREIDLPFDLEKVDRATSVNDPKLDSSPQLTSKTSKDEANAEHKHGQSSSVPLAMSVAAASWHGGLGPMGYVAPLQGVVSMDGTTMASAPIQPPHFIFSQPRPKRCATHCYIARSISAHQQMMKMNPFWPAAAAAAGGPAPLFGAKPYNPNMVPPPADLHAAGRAGVVNTAQDKAQPFAFFPGQSAQKDKSLQTSIASDPAQKKQFLLPQSLPPGGPSNVMHAPAFFFPYGQQQTAAASARPGTAKSPLIAGSVASTTASSSASMGASASAAVAAGPAMSFSYPNMGGNETQFMAILGNSTYPFPIPAHVGAATPYRGSHPQAMSFFNGSFYSSQMLHPSQLQQQPPAMPSQSLQIQQQNHQNPSISTASSSSQKHVQNQQQRPQGSGASAAGASNSNLQNLQVAKGRPSQPQHDVGGEDSPSTADSRTRPNLSVYGQNFAMPFHSPNFALMTPVSSIGAGGSNATVPNGNHGDKKPQQSQQPTFPMPFTSIKGATAPGFDISSMAHNHAILQSLPEASRHNYQIMAAAAQAAQAANHKNNYQDGKTGTGAVTDPSNVEEEMKNMASRTSAASVGQSIAFSRDLAENPMPIAGNNVVDSSARNFNLMPGPTRPSRSSGSNAVTNSNASNSHQQQQMLFPKQQQFGAVRSKNLPTSNGSVFPDPLSSSSVMGAKFQNAIPSFPPLVQSSGAPSQPPQWKSTIRPNTSHVPSPPVAATSPPSTIKNLPQQQARPQGPQQNHTQISFGAPASNPKPLTASPGQQGPNSNQVPSPPMVGSPSTSSLSKSAGGSPKTTTSSSTGNKTGPQASALSTQQQGKTLPSPSLPNQKPSILGSPHMISTTTSASKSQLQESQQHPQLSKQSIQQAQLFFSNAYMQTSANASAGGGYYLQRHRPENQQQHQGSKCQGSGPPISSSGMLSLCASVSMANASTSDPAKAVTAATANSVKGGLPPQGMFHAAQFAAAAQSAGGTHQLLPAGFPYVHAVPTAVQVKPTEQKKPAA